MATAYQYDADGYFAGRVEDHGLLPNNATHTVPQDVPGHIPHWSGEAWEQVENHKGQEGYVNGDPFTVKDYGPLPDGWSYAPPPPTFQEVQDAKVTEINSGYESVMAYIQAGYPDKEVLSWERQATQARELQANANADALFVRSLAATKGVSAEEMAGRILANAESWEPVAAMLTAQRQMMEEAAYAAQSVEEVAAVRVGYSV